MATHLVWLRNDLRIHDNPALNAACRNPDAQVLALYIATPGQWRDHGMSARQAAFLLRNLHELRPALARRGIPLHYHHGDDFNQAVDWIDEFCRRQQVSHLFYNYQYEYNEQLRDRRLEQQLGDRLVCQGLDDGVLLPPGSVLTGGGEMYKVYTPFRNAFLKALSTAEMACVPAPAQRLEGIETVPDDLMPFSYPQQEPGADWPAGEDAALSRLRTFCHQQVADYPQTRDIPALDATSRLSPYLALGVLSPRQCYNRLLKAYPDLLNRPESGAFCWLNELIWRDFYRHLMVAYPRLAKHQPFIQWTGRVAWRQDDRLFDAWCAGLTGFPIVDAAMRQMNQTGWMHNRLRMITASFLVKDLLIDWRRGEQFFMSRLIDGDFFANNGGWQWAASTGTDAAPYFRIFNPTTQGRRFDGKGEFIRRWVPELAKVPDRYLHDPYSWQQAETGGLDYPRPIVDHAKARIRALAAYEAAKNPR